MTTMLYWTVCILGAATFTGFCFDLVDRIEHPRKRSKVGGITRARTGGIDLDE